MDTAEARQGGRPSETGLKELIAAAVKEEDPFCRTHHFSPAAPLESSALSIDGRDGDHRFLRLRQSITPGKTRRLCHFNESLASAFSAALKTFYLREFFTN